LRLQEAIVRKSSLVSVFLLCFGLVSGCGGAAAGNNNSGGGGSQQTATHFSVTTVSSAPSGAAINLTVTALDATNNVVPAYSGTLRFTSTDGQAVLPPNSTLMNGAGTFSATLKTAGSQSITVTDVVTASITGTSNSINVSTPGSLTIASGPPNGTVGQSYGGMFGVTQNNCSATFTGWAPDVTGGTSPYSWSLSAAPNTILPPGLGVGTESFTCGGSTRCCVTVTSPPVLHGTPATAGTYQVTVTVNDSASPPAQTTAAYTIVISPQTNAIPAATSAQEQQSKHHHYELIDLGTFGGLQSYLYIPNNYAPVLNNQGTVVGYADTATPDPFQGAGFCFVQDCLVTNAFETKNGTLQNLSILPGGASSAPGWISPNGLIAGWSQNGTTDPSFPGFPVTHGVLWKDGKLTDLQTLPDGSESVALAVNSGGLVAGAADNSIPDLNPMFSDVYGWATQTRAFVWQDGVMKDIGTLGGTDAVAFLINERAQIVGISYTSSAPSAYCANELGASLTTGAFLYEDGHMKNLGSFGGTCTFPTDLNDAGEVVGLSTVRGDVYQHAFFWEKDSFHELPNMIGGNDAAAIALNNSGEVAGWASLPGDQAIHGSIWKNNSMTDLGTLGGDPCSLGFSINARGQVVGTSGFQQDLSGCNSGNTSRAFLWEDGAMVDLNTLIPADSPLYLTSPITINDLGEIAGIGVDANGDEHAFLLIPLENDGNLGEDASANSADDRVPKASESPASPATSGALASARFRHFIGRRPQ
jgi:probable HAF family extracellular repeat protein